MNSVLPRSTTKRYDISTVIGRLQGVTEGHLNLIDQAAAHGDAVAVLLGSANRARDTRNMFHYGERREMLWQALRDRAVLRGQDPDDVDRKIHIRPLNDYGDKMQWIAAVNSTVRLLSSALRPRVALVGHIRDMSSEYLTWFRAWDFIAAEATHHNATELREAFFSGSINFDDPASVQRWKKYAPAATLKAMQKFSTTADYAYLLKQREAEAAYRATWGPGPFQTVDGVVLCGDHILMIERGGAEGTDMKALPGGFLNAFERTLEACAREVIEETGLFIADEDMPAFKGWLQACHQSPKSPPPPPPYVAKAIELLLTYQRGRGERFDDPYRSRRAHLITEAYLFVLPPGHGLPRVIGSDDAKAAFWSPISEVRPYETFEDHAFIIDKLLSLYGNT